MTRACNSIILVILLLLLFVYFVIIGLQDYQIETRYDTEKGKLSLAKYLKKSEDQRFSMRTLRKHRKPETIKWGMPRQDNNLERKQKAQRNIATYSDELPPESLVKKFFGDDVKKNEMNRYVASPDSMKYIFRPNGRVVGIPQYNGIPKYTMSFGDPDKFDCDDELCFVNGRTIKREMVKENPEDMFTVLPPEGAFLKEFRNPCWKGKDLLGDEKLFCVPYFYIIGFTKCGTTDLFAILNNHTLVSSRAGKESHYFDRLRRGRQPRMNMQPEHRIVSFMSWVNAGKFRQNLLTTYKDNGGERLFHGITVDGTPSHVWDNEYWEVFHPGYREPPVTNPDVIKTISPNAKIIVSLRDPIKRMQSAYQFFCAFGVYDCNVPVTNVKFHQLVVAAISQFNACLLENTVRGCVYSTNTHQLATHMYASMYSVYLTDWFAAFPRDQIYVMMMEEHIEDQIGSINNICDFLEIPRFGNETLEKYLSDHVVRNTMRDELRIPYILPETINILNHFFKPFLSDLVQLLGDEKWNWKHQY